MNKHTIVIKLHNEEENTRELIKRAWNNCSLIADALDIETAAIEDISEEK